ncbi:unnamed protein product, partial [Pleuronectes platessa]
MNGEIEYSLRGKLRGLSSEPFDLDSRTGRLTVKGGLDYEEKQVYEIKVLAADKGAVSLSTHCNVVVRVEDVNDNHPEIEITSLSSRIPEDAPLGTVVALMGVTDLDSGVNGQVVCSVPGHLPFDLKPSPDGQSYSLITRDYLDKETMHTYEITITAKDLGSPALSSTKVIQVDVLDVNDNSPLFTETPYTFYVPENNKAGMSIFAVRATDADEDSGTPSLSSNVTVNVFILDQNDNAPVILYPVSSNGSAEGVEEIPRNVNAGHLVTKVRAYDADIGYNGWLLFSLQEVTDHSLFGLDRYTGQIRTLRSFTETDEAEHKLVILVKDNGNVSLSATATVIVKVVEPKEAFAASDVKSSTKAEEDNNVTFYLMITVGSVSALFLVSIIVLISMQCSKSTDYTSKYLPEPNYDGTLCHSIQYRSGDKRYIVIIKVLDENDNTPEIEVTSLSQMVSEDSKPGTVVSLISITDRDAGLNDCGTPSLSSNVTVNVFILDQNDNSPVILYPVSSNGSAEGVEEIPRNVNAGHLVTKVRAYDADIGYNGWLLFSLQEVTDHSLFGLDRYTGQIRTLRSFTETDEAEHKLVILVKDNGNVSLSATATVIVKVVEPKEAFAASDVKSSTKADQESDVTFYLMITVGSVSALFLVSIIVLISMQCSKSTDYTSKYLPEPNYDGTLCHSIQYRSGDKRYMLVGPRMSIGSTIAPGSHANTLMLPDRRGTSGEETFFDVNQDNGALYVQKKIDREELLLKINATDPDEDSGGEIEYNLVKTLKKRVYNIFELDKLTGEIRVKGDVDYEENDVYKLDIEASDKGTPPLTASDSGTPSLSSNVTVNVFILDQNDNAPVILYPISSNGSAEGVEEIPRNVNAGHLVTKVRAYDADIGYNGWLLFSLQEVTDHSLFGLDRYTGQIRTLRSFTETDEAEHKLLILVKDNGNVSLSATATVIVKVVEPKEAFAASDVKSSTKADEDNNVTFYLMITVGSVSALFLVSIIVLISMQCSKSTDYTSKYLPEPNYDGTLCHSIQYRSGDKRYMLVGPRMSIGSTIAPGSHANTLMLPDRRGMSGEFHVVASDSGTPSLSSNVTVNVFILDQNDNAPVILYPVSSNGSAEGVEEIPRNEVTDHSLFGLDRYTGQIRTLRSFTETDEAEHKLLILVKDNGNVSLSATATVIVKVVEPKEAFAASDCSKSTDYTSKYLPEPNYDGTLCHSIQYRSGDKRYMLVGPRMSVGSTIAPGSHANTLMLPDRRGISGEIKYTTPEEVKVGAVVGNVAKDLGLDVSTLINRRFRIVTGAQDALFE